MRLPAGQTRPAPESAVSPAAIIPTQAAPCAPTPPAEPALPAAAVPRLLAADQASREADELARLCRELPEFRIWRETTCDRTRYIARSRRLGTSPHTVVTGDLAELRDALCQARVARYPAPGGTPG